MSAKTQTIDLQHQPLTFQSLHNILNAIAMAGSVGGEVTIINGYGEMSDRIMHRLELAHIAAHEARVRVARERGEVNER